MIKIKFLNSNEYIEVKFKTINSNVIQLSGEIPQNQSGFLIYTECGRCLGKYHDFTTIYKVVEGGIQFSNDRSVYVEPEPVPEPVESYVPTLEELREEKIVELHESCQVVIYKGVDVQLSTGGEHFSLTTEDQINLFGKQMQVQLGFDQVEYHSDGELCRFYQTADMAKIIEQAVFFISYHTTYCNSLLVWTKAVATSTELDTIFYGADVPEEFQSDVLKSYLIQMGG